MSAEPKHRTVLVVDDHQLLAQTLVVALQQEGIEASVADLASREALFTQFHAVAPSLVLLDLELGGALGDGAALVRPFTDAGARVLVVTGSADPIRSGAVLQHGAVGIVGKAEPFETLRDKTVRAACGEPVMTPMQRATVLEAAHRARTAREELLVPFSRLTAREGQVLRALARGTAVGQIARDWFTSEATVRSQVRAVLNKLGVRSQLEAVALARRTGWLTEEP